MAGIPSIPKINRFLESSLGSGSQLTISGFAYPNETLTASAGSTYQWYIDDVASGTSQTLIPDVNDIGLVVRCVVGGVECTPVTVWHPNQISAVKHFFWAASGAYNVLGNNFTDSNRSIITSGFPILESFEDQNPNNTLPTTSTQNGKPFYKFGGGTQGETGRYPIEVFWDNVNQRWELFYQAVNDDSGDSYSIMQKYGVGITDYPWQATWADGSVSSVATTLDTLATDGQAVVAWRDIISGVDATSSGTNSGLFESTDLDTKSIKLDATDFFSIASPIRNVFNSQNCCYIFAGAQDTAPTGGDTTHGVVSINRTSTIPKLGLFTRATTSVFRASASSDNSTAVNASSTSDANYNVLTAESLFSSGLLNLRVNGSQTATTAISTTLPNNTATSSYIGAATSSSTTNFNGYMTVVILAADDSPISDTDRSRIERFIGLLDSGIDIPLV